MNDVRYCWAVHVNIRGSESDQVCVCRCDSPESLGAVVQAIVGSGDQAILIVRIQREVCIQ